MHSDYPEKRGIGRYIVLLLLVVVLFGGWSVFWFYASGKVERPSTAGARAKPRPTGFTPAARRASAAIRSL